MHVSLRILLAAFLLVLLACSDDTKNKVDTNAKEDHLYRSQFDALEKAKGVETNLQEVYKEREKTLTENPSQ